MTQSAVTINTGKGSGHFFQGFKCFFGVKFLNKSHDPVEDHDDRNGRRFNQFAHTGGDHGADEQDDDQDVFKLTEKNAQRAYFFSGQKRVSSVFGKQMLRFPRCEPGGLQRIIYAVLFF